MRKFWKRESQADIEASAAAYWRCGFTRGYGAASFAEAYRGAAAQGWQPEPWVLTGLSANELAECVTPGT
jgi:hypothetical protein